MSMARGYLVQGGLDYAKRVLTNAFGPERSKTIIDRLVKSLGEELATFDSLQRADPQQVAKFIQGEHPQTIALVLSHLNSSSAGAMLMALPADIRADVSRRMAHLDQISPEIVGKIAGILDGQAQDPRPVQPRVLRRRRGRRRNVQPPGIERRPGAARADRRTTTRNSPKPSAT